MIVNRQYYSTVFHQNIKKVTRKVTCKLRKNMCRVFARRFYINLQFCMGLREGSTANEQKNRKNYLKKTHNFGMRTSKIFQFYDTKFW
jgi:hypothetical protein